MRKLIYVDLDVHKELKVRAAEDGISIKDLVRRILDEYRKGNMETNKGL